MIRVNELFGPTVQGEGKSAGRPVAFLRLAQCNLHCIWCDTPHTWNWIGTEFAHPDKYNKKEELHEMTVADIYSQLAATGMKALVISGGEPFMQQKQLMPLLDMLKSNGWWVEVETNGTIAPRPDFLQLVDQINCSPKLASAGDPEKLRIRRNVLAQLALESKVNFKFVVQDPEDIDQVLELVYDFNMKEVRLMPECRTKDEMQAKEAWVRQLCQEHEFIYCTRLSIEISGTKRGV